jgi:hypothetical protein
VGQTYTKADRNRRIACPRFVVICSFSGCG